jgi:hypothetical protein
VAELILECFPKPLWLLGFCFKTVLLNKQHIESGILHVICKQGFRFARFDRFDFEFKIWTIWPSSYKITPVLFCFLGYFVKETENL